MVFDAYSEEGAQGTIDEMAGEIERLRLRVAELEEALRPFVECCDGTEDGDSMFDDMIELGLDVAVVEARAALQRDEKGKP